MASEGGPLQVFPGDPYRVCPLTLRREASAFELKSNRGYFALFLELGFWEILCKRLQGTMRLKKQQADPEHAQSSSRGTC